MLVDHICRVELIEIVDGVGIAKPIVDIARSGDIQGNGAVLLFEPVPELQIGIGDGEAGIVAGSMRVDRIDSPA